MNIMIPVLVFCSVLMLSLALRAMLAPRVVDRRLARLGSSSQPVELEGESLVHGTEKGLVGSLCPNRAGARGWRPLGSADPPASRGLSETFCSYDLLRDPSHTRSRSSHPDRVAARCLGAARILQIGLLIVVAALFYVLPSMFLGNRIKARQYAITRTLPDALDLMVVCVEAGFGINQSLAQVAEEFQSRCPIVSEEFSLVVQETRAGKSTTVALRSLADRTGVSDISSLVALLVQTERFGTSLANALRVHADAMRIIRMQHAEERAQKATLKLILPSTMIFVALLLIFLAPGAYMLIKARFAPVKPAFIQVALPSHRARAYPSSEGRSRSWCSQGRAPT